MSGQPARRAMSMVELIVVIAVLALLLGLLLPVLSVVSAAGRSAQCASNLRQMAIAAQLYATIFDAWPPAIRYERVDGELQQQAWDWVSNLFGGQLLSPGPLWKFTDNPGHVMQCPVYFGTTNFADPFTGYDYNTTYIGDEETLVLPHASGPVRKGVPPARCRRTSSCAMFGDGGRAGGTHKFMRAPLNSEGQGLDMIYSGGQAFRHFRSTNVAFVDGHTGSVEKPQPGELATGQLLEGSMDYPQNGFLSNDDDAYDPR